MRSNWSRIMAEKTGPGPSRDSSSPPGKSSNFEMSLLYSAATSWSNCWNRTQNYCSTFLCRSCLIFLWLERLPVGLCCWAQDLSLQMCWLEADPELFWPQCNYGGQSLFLFGLSWPPDLSGWTVGVHTWSLSGSRSDRSSEYSLPSTTVNECLCRLFIVNFYI